jgi:hypothetical protein
MFRKMFIAAAVLAAAAMPAGSDAGTTGTPPAMPAVPTVKMLAIGTVVPGADPAAVRAILPDEVRDTVQLYLDGKIDQWYSLQDRQGVVFVLDVTDVPAARGMLDRLPLGRARLMSFELMPLGPLNPLRALPGMSAAAGPR